MDTGKKEISGGGWLKTLRVAAAIGLTLGARSASAAVIYDFNSLADGVLNGKDNWTHVSGTADQNKVVSGAVTYVTQAAEKSKRVNDANWSYEIAGSSTIELSYKARIGNYANLRGSEVFFMAGSANVVSLGYQNTSNKFFIRAADGTVTLSTSVGSTVSSETRWLKLAIDLAGNAGEGSGTFLQSTDGTNWTAVAGLENVDLQLATRGVADTATWDAIALERIGFSGFDDITITVLTSRPTLRLIGVQ